MDKLKVLLVLSIAALAAGCAASGKAVIEQYKDVTPTRFEGAVAVVLTEEKKVEVSEDGKEVIAERFVRIKLLDRKAMDCGTGAPNCRLERGFFYEPGFEEIEIAKARTITPEGEIIEIDMDDMRDMTTTSWLLPEESGRALVYRVKGAVPGSIIEERFRSRSVKNQGIRGFYFQRRDPVLQATYTVNTPVDYKYTWKTYNIDIKPEEQKADNRIIRTWKAKDVPPLILEDEMVAPDDVIAKLMIGCEKNYGYTDVSPNIDVGTWEKRGEFMVDLYKVRSVVTDEVKEIAKHIVEKAETETDKVRELWAWMNKNVRYVARKSDEHDRGILPLSIHTVCTKKYGDCKAVGNFIAVVGREMGLLADPVSIGTRGARGKVELEVPCHQSNHLIARVEADGKVYFLDATNRVISYDTIPSGDQGVHVTVARPGAPFLDLVPIQPPEQSQSVMKVVFVPEEDGTMLVKGERSLTGNLASGFRGRSYAYTSEGWHKWIEKYLALSYPQAAEVEQSFEGKENNNAPFVLKFEAKIPRALQPAGRGVSFEVKDLFHSVIFSFFEIPKRRYPMDLGYLWMRKHRYEVQFPEGTEPVGLPKNVMLDDDFLKVERLSQIENNRVVTELTVSVKKLQIPPEKYLDARQSFQKALDASSYVLIFEPAKKKNS
jgi:hypothetical protein